MNCVIFSQLLVFLVNHLIKLTVNTKGRLINLLPDTLYNCLAVWGQGVKPFCVQYISCVDTELRAVAVSVCTNRYLSCVHTALSIMLKQSLHFK